VRHFTVGVPRDAVAQIHDNLAISEAEECEL
jgi:hypothetical protein